MSRILIANYMCELDVVVICGHVSGLHVLGGWIGHAESKPAYPPVSKYISSVDSAELSNHPRARNAHNAALGTAQNVDDSCYPCCLHTPASYGDHMGDFVAMYVTLDI